MRTFVRRSIFILWNYYKLKRATRALGGKVIINNEGDIQISFPDRVTAEQVIKEMAKRGMPLRKKS